jgi:hypothetical protein
MKIGVPTQEKPQEAKEIIGPKKVNFHYFISYVTDYDGKFHNDIVAKPICWQVDNPDCTLLFFTHFSTPEKYDLKKHTKGRIDYHT